MRMVCAFAAASCFISIRTMCYLNSSIFSIGDTDFITRIYLFRHRVIGRHLVGRGSSMISVCLENFDVEEDS